MAGKRGILGRNFSAFEQAERTDTVVFDKTGTLTKGDRDLMETRVLQPFDRERILRLAAALEKKSDHFIAEHLIPSFVFSEIESKDEALKSVVYMG